MVNFIEIKNVMINLDNVREFYVRPSELSKTIIVLKVWLNDKKETVNSFCFENTIEEEILAALRIAITEAQRFGYGRLLLDEVE